MIPAVWSSYYIDLSPEEMVEQFIAAGWDQTEFSDEHAAVLLQRGKPEAEGRRFAEFASGKGMTFPQGHLKLQAEIIGPEGATHVAELHDWIDLFGAIGIRAGILHPGRAEENADPEEVLGRRVKALRDLADHAAQVDLTICLENVPYCPRVDDLIHILEAVDRPNLAICLDTGHLNMTPEKDFAGFIRKVGKRLKALHIADNEGQTDQHMMPFGKGTVDWPVVMQALREIGYSGLFNLEIGGERHAPLEIRRMKLDYLKRVTDYMIHEP